MPSAIYSFRRHLQLELVVRRQCIARFNIGHPRLIRPRAAYGAVTDVTPRAQIAPQSPVTLSILVPIISDRKETNQHTCRTPENNQTLRNSDQKITKPRTPHQSTWRRKKKRQRPLYLPSHQISDPCGGRVTLGIRQARGCKEGKKAKNEET